MIFSRKSHIDFTFRYQDLVRTMQIKKIIFLFLLIFWGSSVSSQNYRNSSLNDLKTYEISSQNGETQIITDMFDRNVEIPKFINRVVALGAGALRYVVYMNGKDKVCGVENIEIVGGANGATEFRPYALAHPEIGDLPSVGDKWGADPELILQATPDVVITTNELQTSDLDCLQLALNIPVIGLVYGDLDANINLLWEGLNITAQILETHERYAYFKAYVENLIEDLDTRTKNLTEEQKKTCFVGGVSYKGGHGLDSTIPHFDSFQLINAVNVAYNVSQDHAFIDPEQILLWDPEFIFIDGGGFALFIEDLNSRIYDTLQAIQNYNTYILLPYNSYSANFGSILINSYFIGTVLYPDAFVNININETAAEIYTMMVGKDILSDLMDNFHLYSLTTKNALQKYYYEVERPNQMPSYPLSFIAIGMIISLWCLNRKIGKIKKKNG